MLMVVASVTASVMVMNAVFPALSRGANSIVRISTRMEERIESQISIVYATGELDSDAVWQDTDSDSLFDVTVWVKNVGSARLLDIGQSDIFLGWSGYFERIPHVDDAGSSYPQWDHTIENGTEWGPTVTVKFSIHYESALSSTTYFLRVITPTGASNEHYFSF